MNIFKNKKFIISLVAVVVMFVLIVAAQVKASGNERLEQYEKYCQENCELTKVTREELEQTIDTRKGTAIASIEKSSKSISDITKYLTEHELNDEESKMLGSLKPSTEYSKDEEYTVDELIEMETNYSEVSKQLNDLKTSYRTRYLTTQIKTNEKAINKTKTSLKDYDLTDEETKSKKSLDKKLTYDSEKEYTVDELSEFNKTYKSVKSDYSTLLDDVKDRVAEEKAQAEANVIAQEQVVDYTNDYNGYEETPDYSDNSNNQTSVSTSNTSNNSNTSTSNNTTDNASNSNSSNNSVDTCYDGQGRFNSDCIGSEGGTSGNGTDLPDNICPYSSESAAINAAEKQLESNDMNGYATLPCDQGTWEIAWF